MVDFRNSVFFEQMYSQKFSEPYILDFSFMKMKKKNKGDKILQTSQG